MAGLRDRFAGALGWLPRGNALSDLRWPDRHRPMLWVLWLHLPPLWLLGSAGSHHGGGHTTLYLALLALGAALASTSALGRRTRTLMAVLTLVSCSATLVHLTDGRIESHFHFFAVVAFIALYQEWLPFAVASAYVVIHHGLLGLLMPAAVFDHPAAHARPLLWAVIHGGFILLASLANLAAWRLTEVEREDLQRVLDAAGDGIYGVDPSGRITFVNPVLCELVGSPREALEGRDHHRVLGHRLLTGAPVAEEDCPICAVVGRDRRGDGESRLGAGPDPVPVEFVARPQGTRGRSAGSVVTVRDLRERHALEARRRRAEEERDQLASIVEAAPDLALIGRSDGRLVWMNAAGRAMLGFDATEDIDAYRIEDLFSDEEMARIYAVDMPDIARDGDWQGEWELRAQDGTVIPAWVTQHVHRAPAAEEGYVSGIMRDLRPQRAAERARRAGQRQLAAAEGVAGLGSWEWELPGDVVTWSAGMYRLHGLEVGDGRETFGAWLDTVHPEDRPLALAASQRAVSTGSADFTYRAVLRDGRELVINCRGEVIRHDGQSGASMVGTLLDITERHAAAEALRMSEEQARSVVATAGDAYVQVDADGSVTEWNRQAEKVFGWSRQEALGRSFPTLLLTADGRELFDRAVGCSPGGGPLPSLAEERFEVPMRHRSGREIPVEVTPWVTGSGDSHVYSCFIRDISERQAVQRAKDEFLSVVGHELRTPLTSVRGALGLLATGLMGELDERGGRMVAVATRNTDRLVRLINDLLDIDRLTSGRVTLERQLCDMTVLVDRSVEAMRPMADLAGVRLETDPRPGRVWADPDRIEQTLTNLLSNAIKFSPSGTTVRVVTAGDPSMLTVAVLDQGRGIPSEHLERVFDRFQQVDGSDAREKGGTGLGLAICRTIVEQHGGRIWAESAADGGATVTFTLPLRTPGGTAAPASEERALA